MIYRLLAVDRDLDVVDHLTHVHFNRKEAVNLVCKRLQLLFGVGVKGDGTEETDLDALLACVANRGFCDTRGDTVSDDNDIGVFGEIFLVLDLVFLELLISFEAFENDLFEGFGLDIKRVYDVVNALAAVTAARPILFGDLTRGLCLEVDGLHHLTECAVCKDHTGHTVDIGKVKRFADEGCDFLNRVGRENDRVAVAVAERLGCLIIVALCRLDTAETGAASLYVNDNAGKVGADYVGNALALERNSGRRGGGDNSRAGACRAENHVNSSDFAFCLKRKTASFRHLLCHIFGKLGLGGDGVTEEKLTARTDRSLSDSLVALH